MLGRPNRVEPVFTKHFAGPWLKLSVEMPETNVRSSHDRRYVRQQVRDPGAALAVLLEFPLGAQQLRRLLGERVHEGEALARHQRIGNRLAVVFLELRLVVEQFELAGPAGHEQVDDVLRLRRKVGGLGSIGLLDAAGAASSRRRSAADASAIWPRPTPQRLKKCRRVSSSREFFWRHGCSYSRS